MASYGQQWDYYTNGKLDNQLRFGATDRFGNFYLNDERGNIVKLDSLGKLQTQFAPSQYGQLTSIDAWTALRIFLFYQDIQQYAFLDRFLNPAEFIRLPQELFGIVALACPSSDNQLWLLDISPMNLVKYNLNFNAITIQQPLQQLADTIKIKPYQLLEYQNRVYLGDSEIGILVFDNLGNYLHTLPKSGHEIFYPLKEELYFIKNGKIEFIHIYEHRHRSAPLPGTPSAFEQVLLTGRRALLFSNKQYSLYSYKP